MDKKQKLFNEVIRTSDIEFMLRNLLEEQTEEIYNKIQEINMNSVTQRELEEEIKTLKNKNEKLLRDNYLLQENMDDLNCKFEIIINNYKEKEREYKESKEKDECIILELQEERKKEKLNVAGLEKEKKEIEKKFSRYFVMDEAYTLFLKLGEETRNQLRNVFSDSSLECFIASGIQWENIEGLWVFIKNKIINTDSEELEFLHRIFLFLFDLYSKQSGEVKYELIKPAIGSKFDNDKAVILGIKTDGIVQEVLLEGIANRKTTKKDVLYKALINV